MFSTKGRKNDSAGLRCAHYSNVFASVQRNVRCLQNRASVTFYCRSINIPVRPSVWMRARVRIGAVPAASCSRSFVSGGPARPQRQPACSRWGLGPALVVLPRPAAPVFVLRLREEQRVDVTNLRPVLNHAEQEKSLDCLYASSQLALRSEPARYQPRCPGRHTFLIRFLLEGSHCFTVPG